MAVAAVALTAVTSTAQRGPQLAVDLFPPSAAPTGASVIARRILGTGRTAELLANSYPAVLHFRLELWRVGGFFDNLENAVPWDVLVRYDAYRKQYQVVRRGVKETEVLEWFPDRDATDLALEKPFPVQLAPLKAGETYYYNIVLDVTTLSFTDLDELQRWLRGDLQPAVRGKNNPVSALGRGIGTLFSRLLGGERRHYEARTVTFRA